MSQEVIAETDGNRPEEFRKPYRDRSHPQLGLYRSLSIRLDISVLDHLRPARRFVADNLSELGR